MVVNCDDDGIRADCIQVHGSEQSPRRGDDRGICGSGISGGEYAYAAEG